MSKSITLDKVKTLLEPILHIIGKKAERPSWDENDPGSASYIAGRTHYTETIQVEDLPETVLEFASTYSTAAPAYLMALIEKTLDIAVGETRTVVWDGVEYACKANAVQETITLGNLSIAGVGSDTGEPFVIIVYPADAGDGGGLATLDTSPTHTVRIYGEKTVTHQIPSKYLPNMSYVSYKKEQNLTDNQRQLARQNIGAGTSEFDGNYNNLTNKPNVVLYATQTLTTAQKQVARNNIGAGTSNFSGSYNSLLDRPTLATVATSGKYDDLANKPNAVLYTTQTLTDSQKQIARANIGAGTPYTDNDAMNAISETHIQEKLGCRKMVRTDVLDYTPTLAMLLMYDASNEIVPAAPGGVFDGIVGALISNSGVPEAYYYMNGFGEWLLFCDNQDDFSNGWYDLVVGEDGKSVRLATEDDPTENRRRTRVLGKADSMRIRVLL